MKNKKNSTRNYISLKTCTIYYEPIKFCFLMFTQKKVSKKTPSTSNLNIIKLYAHFFIISNKKVSKKYFCIFKKLSTGATFGCREKGSSIIKMSRKISPLSSRLLISLFPYTNTKRAPYKIITISYETLFFRTFL